MLKTVTLTFAQSLDGKIAASNGESRYISEEGSLILNQNLRRDHDAIIVGIGTVICDDPLLTCRTNPERSPLRVILDSSLRMPLESRIAQTSKEIKTIIFYNSLKAGKKSPALAGHIENLENKNIIVKDVPPDSEGFLNLNIILKELESLGVESVMVEGGSSVLTSFTKKNLWDEMIIVSAVKIFGTGIPSFGNLGVSSLSQVIQPRVKEITIIGNEVCWHLVKPEKRKIISSRTVFFTGPRKVDVKTQAIDAPRNGEELYTSRLMGISAGTEKQFYLGNFLQGKKSDPAIDCTDTEFTYPFSYGYINIVENSRGDRFFGFIPHSDKAYSSEKDLISLPDDIDDETALFIPHMETALSIIHDTTPRLGDHLLITGAGVVGTLTHRILTSIMGIEASIFDINPDKGKWFSPGDFIQDKKQLEKAGPFDICIEASGSPAGLQTCLDHSEMEGRITVASWYGEKEVSLKLGDSFHWKRLRLISSQVSNMSIKMGTNWNKKRRLDLVLSLLRKIKTRDLLTQRFPLEDAALAYKLFENDSTLYGLVALIPGG